jgi:type II secretory pathway predicted ATPase ExeA
MYNAYFGFTRRPFAAAPQADLYYPAAVVEAARQTLSRCIQRAEGPALVVGPSGTGKTLLCRVLAAEFADSLKVALLSSGRLATRRNLFQAILYELGRPYRGMDEGELRLALIEQLTTSEDCAGGLLLLVDEGHTLPLRLLEEIRMLTDVARNGHPQVCLVMAGGCVLEERFAHPKLDSFSQRLVARCYLESLNSSETQDYIHAQVTAAGGAAATIFPEDACRSAYRATDGVPRLINQVCDHALLLACAAGQRQLQAAQIEQAWADLQQLPTPWNEETSDQDDAVIEFGGLDDQPADDESPGKETSLPPLRISPDSDRCEEPTGEPADQLEGIQQMLDSVEEDFQPRGSIGPELELVFDDPFEEDFEKEEVVTDRYSVSDDQGPAHPSDDIHEALPPEPQADLPQQDTPAAPDDRSLLAQCQSDLEALPLPRQQSAEEPHHEDILADDDYHQDLAPAACCVLAVPRQEYSRLFTKLRHRS